MEFSFFRSSLNSPLSLVSQPRWSNWCKNGLKEFVRRKREEYAVSSLETDWDAYGAFQSKIPNIQFPAFLWEDTTRVTRVYKRISEQRALKLKRGKKLRGNPQDLLDLNAFQIKIEFIYMGSSDFWRTIMSRFPWIWLADNLQLDRIWRPSTWSDIFLIFFHRSRSSRSRLYPQLPPCKEWNELYPGSFILPVTRFLS